MSFGLPSDFREQVRAQTSLVDLVGESVGLTPIRGGSDYIGLCPFHDDHNPSFHVYPDRQTYRCWVCNEGGDCFSFVMKREAVTFPEAMELLARRANLEIPKAQQFTKRSGPDAAAVHDILGWARDLCHQFLLHSPEAEAARKYLNDRGFTRTMIDKFRVGYHPNRWDWLLTQARNKYPVQQLLRANLISERSQGDGFRDAFLFIDRVVFPIHDTQGRCVAFGGRVLPGRADSDAAKYLNSAESDVFKKSRLAYGLDVARDAIRKTRTAIVVEGYTDCIVCHQYGFENVVGTLGTALTEQHVMTLKRFAEKIVLIYDGDQAGQDAAERALVKFLAQDVDLRILTLPGGADPADYLAAAGTSAFQELIDQAIEAWEFKFQSSLRRFGSKTLDARQRILDEMISIVASVPNLAGTIREDLIISTLSQRLRLSESSIRRQLGAQRNQKKTSFGERFTRHDSVPEARQPVTQDSAQQTGSRKHRIQEQELAEIVLVRPDLISVIQTEVGLDEFVCPDLQQLVQLCFDLHEQGVDYTFDRLLIEIEDPALKRTAISLDDSARKKQVSLKTRTVPNYVEQSIHNLKWRREERAHEVAMLEIANGPSGQDHLDREIERLRIVQEMQKKKRATHLRTT